MGAEGMTTKTDVYILTTIDGQAVLTRDGFAFGHVLDSMDEAEQFVEFCKQTWGPLWHWQTSAGLLSRLRVMRALPVVPCLACRRIHRAYGSRGLCPDCDGG